MAELMVDTTYATALLEAARELGKEQEILEEGREVSEIIKKEEELESFLKYPGISGEEKKEVIVKIFEGRICEELQNFLCVLVDKRRIGRYGKIMKEYETLLEKEEGVSYGVVYSVEALGEEQLAKIEEQTSKLLQTRVKLENEIDGNLIAGIKVLVEGKIIDASYRKKFEEMANQMKI